MTNQSDFPEVDWKTLRSLKSRLLGRASTRALEHIEGIIRNREADPHKAYFELWHVLRSEDEKIARMFDDMRRSNARLKLAEMIRFNLLTTEEIKTCTLETRSRVEELARVNKAL